MVAKGCKAENSGKMVLTGRAAVSLGHRACSREADITHPPFQKGRCVEQQPPVLAGAVITVGQVHKNPRGIYRHMTLR